MNRPDLVCVRHLKLPVSELSRALRWYREVLGFQPELEFPDEQGVVRGVAGSVPGVPTGLALREDPETARGLSGFNPVSWGVADRADLDRWVDHLDRLGITHSPVIEASVGWLLVFEDPDGVEHHLYTMTTHGIDQSDRAGFGRPITAPGPAAP
jgi:catechol 2,3-dioxygenase-like lactoylglutathione lyase family enzyme